MLIEPALAALEQLVDFVLADPIVLGVVQDRNQHVEVIEKRAEASNAGELHSRKEFANRSRVRIYDRIDMDAPTQRFEEQSNQLLAATRRQRRDHGLQRNGAVGELLPLRCRRRSSRFETPCSGPPRGTTTQRMGGRSRIGRAGHQPDPCREPSRRGRRRGRALLRNACRWHRDRTPMPCRMPVRSRAAAQGACAVGILGRWLADVWWQWTKTCSHIADGRPFIQSRLRCRVTIGRSKLARSACA